jgi:carboxylesterase type B
MRNFKLAQHITALLGCLALTRAECAAPTVEIANGRLRGGQCASGNMNYYLSIPYAVAPVGDLRFTSPQPYNLTYDGIRDATQPPPSCPQFLPFFVAYETGQSEDW